MITKEDLQGHWQRAWIKAPGLEDGTTRVHWLQSGALFADIRVPQERPDITGLKALADLSQPALAALMAAEGFAGTISVAEGKCTWHREINWHGTPAAADIGAMSFDAAGSLIEDGVLAEYRELWHAVPGEPLRCQRISCAGGQGILIENDTTFLIALGAPPSGTSKNLLEALTQGTAGGADVAAHFTSTYCLGHWQGGQGIASLSTNPFLEAKTVLTRAPKLTWHAPTFDGTIESTELERVAIDQIR